LGKEGTWWLGGNVILTKGAVIWSLSSPPAPAL